MSLFHKIMHGAGFLGYAPRSDTFPATRVVPGPAADACGTSDPIQDSRNSAEPEWATQKGTSALADVVKRFDDLSRVSDQIEKALLDRQAELAAANKTIARLTEQVENYKRHISGLVPSKQHRKRR